MSDVVAIGLASVLPGAMPFRYKNISSTFRGRVVLAGDVTRLAFIKDLPAKELANELLGACIALTLGLPTPVCYLGRVADGDMALQHAPKIPDEDARYVLVSEDAEAPSLMQLYDADDRLGFEAARRKIALWAEAGLLYGFDSWTANVDRNIGNVLFMPGHVHVIDHGRCFTGPTWSGPSLDPDGVYWNRLKDWLTPCLNLTERPKRLTEAASITTTIPPSSVADFAEASLAEQFLSPTETSALLSFLTSRLAKVKELTAPALELASAA